jgi:hypothetical protein
MLRSPARLGWQGLRDRLDQGQGQGQGQGLAGRFRLSLQLVQTLRQQALQQVTGRDLLTVMQQGAMLRVLVQREVPILR